MQFFAWTPWTAMNSRMRSSSSSAADVKLNIFRPSSLPQRPTLGPSEWWNTPPHAMESHIFSPVDAVLTKCFNPLSSSNLLNLLLFYVRAMPSFLYRQPEMHWKELQSMACKWSQNSIHPLTGIAGPLRILTCICCQFVCCNRNWRRWLRRIRHCRTWEIIVYMYRLHCMILYYFIWSWLYNVDLDAWFTIHRKQSLQKVFDDDDDESSRSSWMSWPPQLPKASASWRLAQRQLLLDVDLLPHTPTFGVINKQLIWIHFFYVQFEFNIGMSLNCRVELNFAEIQANLLDKTMMEHDGIHIFDPFESQIYSEHWNAFHKILYA